MCQTRGCMYYIWFNTSKIKAFQWPGNCDLAPCYQSGSQPLPLLHCRPFFPSFITLQSDWPSSWSLNVQSMFLSARTLLLQITLFSLPHILQVLAQRSLPWSHSIKQGPPALPPSYAKPFSDLLFFSKHLFPLIVYFYLLRFLIVSIFPLEPKQL